MNSDKEPLAEEVASALRTQMLSYELSDDEEQVEQRIRLINLVPFFFKRRDALGLVALCMYRIKNPRTAREVRVMVNETRFVPQFLLKFGLPFIWGYRINFWKITIPAEDVITGQIQNKMWFVEPTPDGEEDYIGHIHFTAIDRRRGKNRVAALLKIKGNDMTLFFRQSARNAVYIVARKTTESDALGSRLKIVLGRYLSFLPFDKKSVLFYEKESETYEESASVVYERLIDMGYRHVYYVLDKDYPYLNQVEERYKTHLVAKNSINHYRLFFRTDTFVGTESIAHAVGLRIANRYAMDKMSQRKFNSVFLQHGVMYMIALETELRKGFHKKEGGLQRVVVSSQLEAQHFTDFAEYDAHDMYITGLPKYDRSILLPTADKIVIMPTWRRWEVNKIKYDFENSKYYKLIARLIRAIPKEYRSKIIVLPHPHMASYLQGVETDLSQYFPQNKTYAEVLKETALLITDYSSISFDAFYRGSNVIFYWGQLEMCLSHYGERAHLMIDEETAFGDVCNTPAEFQTAFLGAYMQPQKREYQKRYQKIVEFHDGKNTERVIQKLIADGFLPEPPRQHEV